MNYDKIAEYCRQNWAEECAHVIRIADEVSENKFLFDMPWDMERTVEQVDFKDNINWGYMHNGDNEFLFQLNRHRFFIILGQAYRLTGDEKYARNFVRLALDWIAYSERNIKDIGGVWRSLEVGLRGEYWTKAMRYFEGSPAITDDFLLKYRESLRKHGELLRNVDVAYHTLSNWGVIQDHGLFAIGLELNDGEYINYAAKRLADEAAAQVMRDGNHWEQSCMYHNEVLLCFLDSIMRAREYSVELPEIIYQTARRMAEADIKWIKPNHRQPLYGDSDDTDLRDVLTLAGYLLKEPLFKGHGYDKLDYESAWLFGEEGIREYTEMGKEKADYLSVALDDCGTYILRSDWSENANYLRMHNGFSGGGHCHADKLHISLCYKGEDLLVDGGRYNYQWVDGRKKLKRADSHNVTTVDGRDFVRFYQWGVIGEAPSVKGQFVSGGECEYISGGHLGYMRALFGTYVSREILWIKPDIYLVLDKFIGLGIHKYRQYFHFNPVGKVNVEGNKAVYTGENISAEAVFMTKKASVKKVDSIYSPHYNRYVANDAVRCSFYGAGDRSGIAVFYGAEKDKIKPFSVRSADVTVMQNNKKLKDKKAVGLVINCGRDEYTVFIAYKEIKTALLCNGNICTGKINVFKDGKRSFVNW